ncbi:PQQ-binding-like beta-propeller repeat protein [Aeromicrobium sp. NPDC092404]|uniref:outer membrane protein assembly factor BamB family protein n=1 Tax=Aeromicrobium sp. NPDC092404 TaxID=3154976 RepID=UPI0034343939
MRRLAAVVAGLLLALAACTGGGDDTKDKDGPSLPLPDKAPSARGPAVGPALEPKVLLAASDDLEELTGSLDTAQVQRRSGAFISGRKVVGYSVDDISGYDLESGDKLWTADLDLEGGTACYVSEPDRAVKTFTVVYGEGSYCPKLATIRVSDGKVMKKSDKLNELAEFEGDSAGGTVNHLFTVTGRDYLVDMHGVVWKMAKGEPEPVSRLEGKSYYDLSPTPKGDVLIGSRADDRSRCPVDGYELPSFEPIWSEDAETLFPGTGADCGVSVTPGSSSWIGQETSESYRMAQLDPDSGKVLGRAEAPKNSGGGAAKGEFDLASAANQSDRALGMPGGETIFAQVNGLTRYSLETGKVLWDLDLNQVQLESDEEFPLTTVLPQGVTADGYLVASVSNDTSVEIVAVDVKTGKLVARWAVPKEYRNGFQVDPGMTLFGGGLVLTRNFEAWDFTFADYKDLKPPKGDRFDIGVFTFPEPDTSAAKAAAVPTAGPVDVDAKALGGAKTPKAAEGDRKAGAFSTGTRLVAYGGNTLTGFDAKSGDQKWTLDVGDDAGARVCVASEPDRKVKTFTVAVRDSAEDTTCDSLLRVRASDGEVLSEVQVPAKARSVARIVVHEGAVYVITGDARVSHFKDGALVDHAKLRHPVWTLERTPEDPSLLVSTSSLKGGRDWSIDAYELPSFEPVWSTTGKKVFGKIDRRNWIDSWHGNGLWMSTTFGDTSNYEAEVRHSLVQLDPSTGQVAAKTGTVKQDFRANDLETFSLTSSIASAYVTVGFEDGDVVVPQESGVMRMSIADKKPEWTVDTKSIMDSMERDRGASSVEQHFKLIDGGKTVLVTMSNGISAELMTLKASSGKITGRWNVPVGSRNGLQSSPDVVPFAGGVALVHNDYAWDYDFRQSDRKVPPEQRYDVGLFRLTKPK